VTQILYGIHPVKEALKSPHLQFQKIFIGTKQPHPSLQSVLDLAIKRQIPVTFSIKETLDKIENIIIKVETIATNVRMVSHLSDALITVNSKLNDIQKDIGLLKKKVGIK